MKTKTKIPAALLLALLLPAALWAQSEAAAKEILGKAQAAMEALGDTRLLFEHRFTGTQGEPMLGEEATLCCSGEKFFLDSEKMKVWCNGTMRWNYIVDNDEIYISDMETDFAQTLTPHTMFKLYERGFSCTLSADEKESWFITMEDATVQFGFSKLLLRIGKKDCMPMSVRIFYADGYRSDITLKECVGQQRYSDTTFECITSLYDAEVIDMR